jgi:hypothetical protein
MKIRLTNTELLVAGFVGSLRNVQGLCNGWTSTADLGTHNSWTPNIEGVCGEIAVARLLNIYWRPIVGNPDAEDVGPYEVRTNLSRKHTDMCLRPSDEKKKHRIFISVLSFTPEFEVLGWLTGAEAMRQEWFREGTPGRPKCFYAPAGALNPMNELPK